MSLTLEIVSRQKDRLGERARMRFDAGGGNIGRSVDCDWVLPDPDRFISSRHAAIDFRSGSFYVIDTSSNGVFVNDSDTPVGRGKPQRLFNGDRVRMGEFLMRVVIEGEDGIDLSLQEPDPVDRAQRVESPPTSSQAMLDEFEITGVINDLQLEQTGLKETQDSFRPGSTQPMTARKRSLSATAAATRTGTPLSVVEGGAGKGPAGVADAAISSAVGTEAPAAAAATPARTQTASSASGADAVNAFMRAAGLDPATAPRLDAEELMRHAGQLLREMVVGLSETLHDRAQQKSALRLGNTTIQPRQNNPLKFSAGVDEALARLLQKPAPEYMPPVEAVRESFRDIRQHQAATMQAMREALLDFMERLEPAELQERFEQRGSRRSALLPGSAKGRYWDMYGELHQVLSQHAPGEFPQLFAEEFASAYERALQELQSRRQRA